MSAVYILNQLLWLEVSKIIENV